MIPEHDAKKLLIKAGYTVDMQSPYRHVTVVDAPNTKKVHEFLRSNGYEGDYVAIGRRRRVQVAESNSPYDSEGKHENAVCEAFEQMTLDI
jgi:hypothetical protein